MLAARQGRRRRAGRVRLTRATSASRCSWPPPRAPRRPRRRYGRFPGCSEERRVRDARRKTGPPAQSRARTTYSSDVSVVLLMSASESAAAPASPILLLLRLQRRRGGSGMLVARQGRRHRAGRARPTNRIDVSDVLLLSASESAAAPATSIWFHVRLQRGEECQGRSWRDRAASAEQGARDLLERRQKAQFIRKLVTIPPAFELLQHNCYDGVHQCYGVHLCAVRTPRQTSAS
jgi:hypothetical protein